VVPWGLARLRDGSLLVAQRNGRVVRVTGSGSSAAGTVPGVRARGEGGLLGLAAAPADPSAVFAYLTSTAGDNRVLRIPLAGGRLDTARARVLLRGIPASSNHDGGRLAVGPDGNLWIGTGDAGTPSRAQDRRSLGGKILRISRSGAIPADNPFRGSPVWSLGHRNVQGLAFDARGRLWATEFGQNTWDELNLIRKGGNYGWPRVEGSAGRRGLIDPQVIWRPRTASPSGLAVVGDVAYAAGLRGERLWQIPVGGSRAGRPVAHLTGAYGRLRTVEPDGVGGLWVTTSNRDSRGTPVRADDRLLHVRLG
jgi:glucose/arabinose dehydrogenase